MEAACTKLLLHTEVRWLALNKSMQGKNENILTRTDKINRFKVKLTLWGTSIKKENEGEMFEPTKVSD
jgi:hypothetical protein